MIRFKGLLTLGLAATFLVACGSESSSSASATPNDPESSFLPAESSSSRVTAATSSSAKTSLSSEAEAISSSSKEPASSSSSVETNSSSAAEISSTTDAWYFDDTDGSCEKCDNYTAQDPVLTDIGGKGSITTYGSVTAKETSLGGACNYGETNIQYYAAIHVNVSSGDNQGPWNGGLACGGCVRVKAKTPDGWKRVTVRITDRCPDANCGVDLGGAPASDIMGDLVGRYYGEWEFVSCEGVDGVWGDSSSIWVKEGASSYWSIIQVRNPKDAVTSISFSKADAEPVDLEYAIEAENFWSVPQEVLQTDDDVKIIITYRSGSPDTLSIAGSAFAKGEANYYLYEYR